MKKNKLMRKIGVLILLITIFTFFTCAPGLSITDFVTGNVPRFGHETFGESHFYE